MRGNLRVSHRKQVTADIKVIKSKSSKVTPTAATKNGTVSHHRGVMGKLIHGEEGGGSETSGGKRGTKRLRTKPGTHTVKRILTLTSSVTVGGAVRVITFFSAAEKEKNKHHDNR